MDHPNHQHTLGQYHLSVALLEVRIVVSMVSIVVIGAEFPEVVVGSLAATIGERKQGESLE